MRVRVERKRDGDCDCLLNGTATRLLEPGEFARCKYRTCFIVSLLMHSRFLDLLFSVWRKL